MAACRKRVATIFFLMSVAGIAAYSVSSRSYSGYLDIYSASSQRHSVPMASVALAMGGTGNAIRCSICETNESGQQCLTNPPAAKLCGEGFHYCILAARYYDDGDLSSFTRSCSPIALPDSCFPTRDRKTLRSLQVCYVTCSKDGCNSSSSLHHILDLIKR